MALRVHDRRSLRLKEYNYSQPGAYFTMCVKNRECLLGSIIDGKMKLSKYGLVVAESWQWLSPAFPDIFLDEWTIIMPNHLHGIIFINQPCRGGSRAAPIGEFKIKPLGQIIGAFKTVSTKEINIYRQTPGIPFWQRGFYEHVIRDEKSLNRIREYILSNPQRWQIDRENQKSIGEDEFDRWLAKFHPKPTKKDIAL